MIIRSIQARMAIGAALSILLALSIAGAGLLMLFQRHIEHREMLSLEAKAMELLPNLRIDQAGNLTALKRPSDDRFWQPASGLYWQVSTAGTSILSRSLWDQSLPTTTDVSGERWKLRHINGPFGRGLLVISRLIHPLPTHRPVLVQFATDDDMLQASRREFGRETVIALAILWVVFILAAVLHIHFSLHPFRKVQAELARMLRNPATRLGDHHPREILPLIATVNDLADARSGDLQRARLRAADLAHSLKTPLAAMAAQSRQARAEGAPLAADAIDRTIAIAQAAIEAELARARTALARGTEKQDHAALDEAAESVVLVIERTDIGRMLVFETDISTDATVPVSNSDLVEMIGAIVENAARFARRRVSLSSSISTGSICLHVDDDGPGMDAGRIEQALVRGARLDESSDGHGFGLAIVKDLIEASGGAISFARSSLGGLRVTMTWPAAIH